MSPSTAGLQALLAEVLRSPDPVARLETGSAALAAEHGVDGELVRRLAAQAHTGVRASAVLSDNKRREAVQRYFEGTYILAAYLPEADRALHLPELGTSVHGDTHIRRIGRELTAAADRLPVDEPFDVLRDMLRFECLWTDVRIASRTPADAGAGAGAGVDRACGPALAPGALLAEFRHPVAELRKRLRAGQRVGPFEPSSVRYLLAPGEGESVRVRRVSPTLGDLLALCDGTRDLAGLSRRTGAPQTRVAEALGRLAAEGAVRIPHTGG